MTSRKITAFFLSALLLPATTGAAELRAGLYRYDGGVGLYSFSDGQHVVCDDCRLPPVLPASPPALASSFTEEPAAQIVIEVPDRNVQAGDVKSATESAEDPLATVYFRFNEAVLEAEEKSRIRQVVPDTPGPIVVRVAGHACRIGTHEYNMALSLRRSEAVASYLRSLGKQVVAIEGFGDSRPLGGPVGKDRRAEILIKERM